MSTKSFYILLGVSPSASRDEIDQAYKILAKKIHPDLFDQVRQGAEWGAANEAFKELNHARSVLLSPDLRAKHDAELLGLTMADGNTDSSVPQPPSRASGSAGLHKSVGSVMGAVGFVLGGFTSHHWFPFWSMFSGILIYWFGFKVGGILALGLGLLMSLI
jgi:curved DNA-binding protein